MASRHTMTRAEIARVASRLGIAVDDTFLEKAVALSLDLAERLERLPTAFSKDVEPANVFAVPRR